MKSKYKVHVYATVRVPFEVDAESFEEAARQVLADAATHERLHAIPGYAEDYENELVVDRLSKDGRTIASTVINDESRIDRIVHQVVAKVAANRHAP